MRPAQALPSTVPGHRRSTPCQPAAGGVALSRPVTPDFDGKREKGEERERKGRTAFAASCRRKLRGSGLLVPISQAATSEGSGS